MDWLLDKFPSSPTLCRHKTHNLKTNKHIETCNNIKINTINKLIFKRIYSKAINYIDFCYNNSFKEEIKLYKTRTNKNQLITIPLKRIRYSVIVEI